MSDLIWVKPNIQCGVPCIAGTRIPVVAIQSWAQEGFSNERIRDEFPGLTDEQIDAAKAYNAAPVSPDSDLLKEAVGLLDWIAGDVEEGITITRGMAGSIRAFLSKVEERGHG